MIFGTLTQCDNTYMDTFKKEFLEIIPNFKFQPVKDIFQKKLKEGIPKIKQSPDIFVFADKASNIYQT